MFAVVYVPVLFVGVSCLMFFFKQKTAYEMRISDWSSDVRSSDLPVVRDPYSHSYLRQEQKGLLVGPYETAGAETCFDDGVPWSFDQELLPPALDRLEPFLEKATERMPIFGKAGIRRVISAIGRASWRERVCQYV